MRDRDQAGPGTGRPVSGPEVLHRGLIIGGAEQEAASGEVLSVLNPATGAELGTVACAGEKDVDAAVAAATRAFASGVWRDLPIHQRARAVNRFADGIERRIDDLFRLETLNNGRPITETRAQISRLPEWYHYNAALLLADRDSGGAHARSVPLLHQPLPAWRRRDPVVVQPPAHDRLQEPGPRPGHREQRRAQALRADALLSLLLADIAAESGIPPGVLNVIVGLGPVAGAALTEHPDVHKVVFTGGTEVGRQISVAVARRFGKATLELGGKSPVLVFADSPLEQAVRGAAFGGFVGAGQTCIVRHEDPGRALGPRRLRRRTRGPGRADPHR